MRYLPLYRVRWLHRFSVPAATDYRHVAVAVLLYLTVVESLYTSQWLSHSIPPNG